MRSISSLLLFVAVTSLSSWAQDGRSYFDLNYFNGNIALHNDDILHLISGHPDGVILSWNKGTDVSQPWAGRFNYPDYGLSFSYQDLKHPSLGENYAVYGHYNFYFLKRRFVFRIGQGIALTTKPYHRKDNPRNIAFGSRIMSSTYVMLNYKKESVFGPWGIQAGLALFHYSNANVKAPNTSINSVTFNTGITYTLESKPRPETERLTTETHEVDRRIHFTSVLRTGVNESDVIGTGQYVFYTISGMIDKQLNQKSRVQLGFDLFLSNFLKRLIAYESVAFPERNIDPDTDYKRFGFFAGHELLINRLSLVTQFGYYLYYPYDFEGRTYQRVGLRYTLGKKWFAAMSLKSHAARAEALEFGIGIRL